ncbi:unnamed protein product [Musa acuminata subsp. burmannicoides]
MAPSSNLKQSSMDSFLHHHHHHDRPNPTAISKPETPAAEAASDYERIRRETIRRNQEFLQKLGIASATTIAHKNQHTSSKRRPRPPPASSFPLRRSSRNKRPPHDAADTSEDPAPELPDPSLIDSSVFQYVCDDEEAPLRPGAHLADSPSWSSPIVGFRVFGKAFRDPSLARIYSIDVCSSKKDRFLVAAGGHRGFISVYGGEWGDCEKINSDGEMMDGPLMSWKGSPSWVSGVKFVEDNPMLLVSSSNDGAVVVWDLKKQPSSLSSWSPPVVAKSTELHTGGVYSMDRFSCWIATASKDSSVGVSRLTPAGELVVERNITGHHSGVIRGVCFGDGKERLADCGVDGRICVLDPRSPEPCALTIKSLHSTGVNMVEWNKWNNFLILSAGSDPILHLYDIRNAAGPVHSQLQGHVESNTGTCDRIYRPCFVGGKTIATPGQGTRKISLFDVEKATLISQGILGTDANLIMFKDDQQHPRLWSAAKQINQLCPLAQT